MRSSDDKVQFSLQTCCLSAFFSLLKTVKSNSRPEKQFVLEVWKEEKFDLALVLVTLIIKFFKNPKFWRENGGSISHRLFNVLDAWR